jgi:glutaminyl-peptide cyclotransferase
LKKLLLFAFFIGALFACKTDEPKSKGVAADGVKNVKLNFLNLDKNRKVVYGDSLLLELVFEANEAILKAEIKSGQRTIQLTDLGSNKYYIDTKYLGGGYYSLKTEVLLADSTLLKGSGSVAVVLPNEPAKWDFKLIETYPHDNESYTQGLIWHNNTIYESAGLYARSDIRQVNLKDGVVIQKKRVDDSYFAEGLCIFNNELFQLTWREKVAMVFDPSNLQQKRAFDYNIGNGEGWGLTHDGTNFIFSDGSANLYFLNSENWSMVRELRVFDHRGDVTRLNELEYVNGKIYANILDDNRIAVISPTTGEILAYWNLEALLKQPGMQSNRLDVMNGIAHRSDRNTFLVTGKLWPKLFEIVPVTP